MKEKCNSFGTAWDKNAEDCLRCKDEFSDEYTKCKKQTLNLSSGKTKKKPKHVSVAKLCKRLMLEGKNRKVSIPILTKKCIELGMDEVSAKKRAENTWGYVLWKKKEKKKNKNENELG